VRNSGAVGRARVTTGGVTETVFQAWSEVAEQETVTLGSFIAAPSERIRVLALGPSGQAPGEMEPTPSLVQEQGAPGALDRVLIE
jgi:hypothetical protein